MSYTPLNNDSVLTYVADRPAVMAALGEGEVTASEVGDGNLNQVFILGAERQVILKQALPYLRVVGESHPLTRDRMRFEVGALLLQNEFTPDRVPNVIDHDLDMSLVVMEFLGDHEIMRGPLMRGERFESAAGHLGTFMAELHYRTSDLHLAADAKKSLQVEYSNPALCKIQEDFVYTNPYMDSPENEWNPLVDTEVRAARNDAELKMALVEIKDQYMTRGQALVHGDMHTGSIMVTETDTKLIDPEFAFYGPIGYDVGTLFANLAINYASHLVHTPDPAARSEIQRHVGELLVGTWTAYARHFDELWRDANTGELVPPAYWDFDGGEWAFASFRERYLRRILADSAGHGAAEMMRRLMGIVTVPDLGEIESDEARATAQRPLLRIARRWIVDRAGFSSAEDLLAIVRFEVDAAETAENSPGSA